MSSAGVRPGRRGACSRAGRGVRSALAVRRMVRTYTCAGAVVHVCVFRFVAYSYTFALPPARHHVCQVACPRCCRFPCTPRCTVRQWSIRGGRAALKRRGEGLAQVPRESIWIAGRRWVQQDHVASADAQLWGTARQRRIRRLGCMWKALRCSGGRGLRKGEKGQPPTRQPARSRGGQSSDCGNAEHTRQRVRATQWYSVRATTLRHLKRAHAVQ